MVFGIYMHLELFIVYLKFKLSWYPVFSLATLGLEYFPAHLWISVFNPHLPENRDKLATPAGLRTVSTEPHPHGACPNEG